MSIPKELLTQRRWVCWREEKRGDSETRVPCQPNGMLASSTDPATWSDFDTCFAAVGELTESQGVGYVLGDDNLVGVDLDDCRNPDTGELEGWADELVDKFDSYTEVSPSGCGVHVWLRAAWDESGRRNGRLEAYRSGRYLTVTGDRLPGTPETIERRDQAFRRFCETHFAPTPKQVKLDVPPPARARRHDAQIVELAQTAKNGEKFRCLYDAGDVSGYDSHSEADLALCAQIAWWTKDPAQIDRLFRTSALIREKWDERRNTTTYGERTVAKALSGMVEGSSAASNGFGSTEPNLHYAHTFSPRENTVRIMDAEPGGGLSGEPSGVSWQTPAEIFRDTPDEIEWLVRGFISNTVRLLLTGFPKVGKSTFLFYLLSALRQGRSVLDLDIGGRVPEPL